MFQFLEMIPLFLGLALAPALPGVEMEPLPPPVVPIVTAAPEETPQVTPPAETEDPSPTEEPRPTPSPDPEETGNSLYILMYHDFVREGEPCGPWTMTDTRFREDLQWLSDHGYTTVLPSEVIAGDPLPEKAVLLSLDDGYASNYQIAAPILEEFQAKAVISLIVERRDSGYPNAMTWDMCRELLGSGRIEFGSHTYNAHEERQWVQRVGNETQEEYEARIFPDIQKSIDRIEEELGTKVQYFAYPQGRSDPWSDEFIQSHFEMTVTSEPTVADLSHGLYKLPRITVYMDIPLSRFLPE